MIQYVLYSSDSATPYASFRNWKEALAYHDETVRSARTIGPATYRIVCCQGARPIWNEIQDAIAAAGNVTRFDRKSAA